MENNENIRCLVIDDEEDFAEYVADALDAIGIKSDLCSDPTEIGTVYCRDHDVIFLDLFMPGMDGIEMLRFLHDNQSTAALVFMSGKDLSVLHSAGELASEWKMQVLGVLQKPFTIDDVSDVVSLFKKPLDRVQRSQDSSVDAVDLRTAMKERQLYLVYQPQVRASDFTTVGLETLVRWEHPEKGFISPGEFVPLAEQTGLIRELDSFVCATAVTQLGTWKKQGYDVSMSINVSPASITDLDLPERLIALTASQGVEPSDITLEVTETAVMSDVGKFMDVLTRARMRGFGLAIDDFGTGYSSLQQLVRLPFTEMKIDLSFVIPILRDRECRAVSHAAIMLGHELGMHVVAEGVESLEVAELLRNMGIDVLQGYHFSKPLKAEELEKFMITEI